MEYRIDATHKVLGRLAGRAALLLCGKNQPAFNPAKISGNRVVVYNVSKMRVTGKKPIQKIYHRHSGYPGALRSETLSRVMERDSRIVLRRAIMGMLPKNRLRPRYMRRLTLVQKES